MISKESYLFFKIIIAEVKRIENAKFIKKELKKIEESDKFDQLQADLKESEKIIIKGVIEKNLKSEN